MRTLARSLAVVLCVAAALAFMSPATAAESRISWRDDTGEAPARVDLVKVTSVTRPRTIVVRVRVERLPPTATVMLGGQVWEEGFNLRIDRSRQGTTKAYRWCYVGCSEWRRSRGTRVDWDAGSAAIRVRIPARALGIRSFHVECCGGLRYSRVTAVVMKSDGARDSASYF